MTTTKKNSVLIVDDEKSNIIALTHILSSEYTIYFAKNGMDAIELAERFLPDVILLDILMPEMDGYEVISRLKKGTKTNEIPVIFITGLTGVEEEDKGLSSGAADYISKPFSSEIVKLRVRSQIQMLNQIRLIKYLSMMDQLTDLPNRRNFDSRMRTEWEHAIRNGAFISLLMIDIDFFKNYNDKYGHQQGDVALKAMANIFKQTLKRSVDFAARWGGEEFVVLLPNTNLNGAMGVAEVIRAKAVDTDIISEGSATRLTLSIGVNTLKPDQGSSLDSFISGADKALYTAKENGRNQVRSWGR
jgi:diguanylate cyclase (GGDEF)-like protein